MSGVRRYMEKIGSLSARGGRNTRDRTFIDGEKRMTEFFDSLPSIADINNAMMDCIWTNSVNMDLFRTPFSKLTYL